MSDNSYLNTLNSEIQECEINTHQKIPILLPN